MPTYMVRANYTEAGIKGMMGGGKNRRAAIAAIVEAAGGTLKDMYMTTGSHDVLAICDMPNADSGMAVNMVIGASGVACNFETIRCWSPEEFEEIAGRAAGIASAYTPPSG